MCPVTSTRRPSQKPVTPARHPTDTLRAVPDWQVPLADVVVPEDDIAIVADVYRSGWLSMGPRTAEFERALEEYTGARHALGVANGTAALHLLCLAAGLGPGDEAIVPSLTFVASVNAIAYTGATPVFADIAALDRPWPTADAVEAAITPRTKAIMAVAYGGHPGEIEALRELADGARPAAARGRRARDRRARTAGATSARSARPARSRSSRTRTSRSARAARS